MVFVRKSLCRIHWIYILGPHNSHQLVFMFLASSPIPVLLGNYSRPLSLLYSTLAKAQLLLLTVSCSSYFTRKTEAIQHELSLQPLLPLQGPSFPISRLLLWLQTFPLSLLHPLSWMCYVKTGPEDIQTIGTLLKRDCAKSWNQITKTQLRVRDVWERNVSGEFPCSGWHPESPSLRGVCGGPTI